MLFRFETLNGKDCKKQLDVICLDSKKTGRDKTRIGCGPSGFTFSVLRDIVGSDAEAVISDTDSETNSNSDGYPYSDSESDMISESLSEDDMISESLSEDDATAELEFIPGTMEQLIQSLLNSIDEEDS
ncbi:hypothetical protein TNCT_98001 [Trichonephila clavata]|uniref:Uncharacterized protein n=1 Tax=Trichonephila clavata TaxID=2740835 RepID=A0A8X6HSC3_TRICU|nr:hypothetical protein TNCT_98001 [Trichonephila clavata]